MNSLEQRFAHFIREKSLFSEKDKLLVGISGGPDSVCLAFLLFRLGFHFDLAHVNYHLRGKESDEDESYCKALASHFQCQIHLFHAPIEKTNVQEKARAIRYEWFMRLKREFGYDYILTAHHWDDQIETILYYFTRGASYHLFHPIPVKTESGIRRPLLFATKEEILSYLKHHNIAFRADSSNLLRTYLRNRIRLEWIPLIQQINPAYQSHFQHQLQIYEEQFRLLEKLLTPYQKQWIQKKSDQTLMIALPSSDAFLEWKHVLYQFFSPLYSTYDLQRLFALYHAKVGKKVELKHHVFLRERGYILGISKSHSFPSFPTSYILKLSSITFPYVFQWNRTHFTIELVTNPTSVDFSLPNSCYMDVNQIDSFLRFRVWQKGDRIVNPLGLKGSKLVSDILNEMKIPTSQKPYCWVIEDRKGILYVQNYRICERVKITSNTTSILKISWKPEANFPFRSY